MQKLGAYVFVFVGACILAGVWGIIQARDLQASMQPPGTLQHLPILIPAYPHAPFMALGESLHVGGAGREVAYANTDDSPKRVLDTYAQLWKDEGLKLHEQENGAETTLMARAKDDAWLRTLVVMPRGEGSMLLASVRKLAKPDATSVQLPPHCKASRDVASSDVGQRYNSQFITCQGFVEGTLGYFESKYADAKRRELHNQYIPERMMAVEFHRETLAVTVALTQTSVEPPQCAGVLITEHGARKK